MGLKIGGFEVTESTPSPEEGDWYHGVRSGGGDQPVDTVLIKFLAGSSGGDALVDLSKQHDILGALADPHIPTAVGFFEGVGALAVQAPLTASLEQAVRLYSGFPLRCYMHVNAQSITVDYAQRVSVSVAMVRLWCGVSVSRQIYQSQQRT